MKYTEQERVKMIMEASNEVVELYEKISYFRNGISLAESGKLNMCLAGKRIEFFRQALPELEAELVPKLDNLLHVHKEANMGDDLPNEGEDD